MHKANKKIVQSKLSRIEFESATALVNFQSDALGKLLPYLAHSMHYSNKLRGIDLKKVSLRNLPFTTKEEMQGREMEFLCIPVDQVSDWTTTSGTTGEPVCFGITKKDIARLGQNEMVTFLRAGINQGDVIQLTTTIDKRFMAGLAYLEGARKLGCPLVRMGPGAIGMQIDSIRRFSVSVLIGVPSFFIQVIRYAEARGIDLEKLSVRKLICIGEPIRLPDFQLNAIGSTIKSSWNVEIYSTYASTEMSTAFSECRYGNGGHLNPELGILEVLDESDVQVGNGESGEIVFTSLGVEGMPLLRYRTGDMAHFFDERCRCGSYSPRIGPIIGRKQQCIKYKGTTIYPNEIINLMNSYGKEFPYIIEIDRNEFGNDELRISVSIDLNEEEEKFKLWIRENMRVIPEIINNSSRNINQLLNNPENRKSNRVFDYR